MIIGIDASRAFSVDKTGTENYSFQLLKALAKIDKKNKYILYTRGFNNVVRTTLMKFPGNFKVKEIKWPRLWTQGGLAWQTFKDNLDLLFVPAHTLPLIRKPGLKTVVTVHDLGSEYLPSMHQVKQRLYLSLMQKYQLKTASKIIAVSKATKNDLIRRIGISGKKIEVVYEGYDQQIFNSQFSIFKAKNDILVNTLRRYGLVAGEYFLFVGTVQPRKNIERLIKAFSVIVARRGAKNRSTSKSQSFSDSLVSLEARQLTRDYTIDSLHFLTTRDFATSNLVIIGKRGWLSDEIYELPKKLGIENSVKFLGYVSETDLSSLYSGAIALTFPSLFEGFGLPILEAQACGCPVITSNSSSMPEVAGPDLIGAGKGALLVDPYDVEAITNAMIRVGNKEERVKLIKEGFVNVNRFSWEKCATQTLEVFEKVIQ